MSRAWMPLYIGDYLADTGNLTTQEHGAYILLIMHYWQKESLPEAETELAEIAKVSAKDWTRIGPKLARLFLPGWKHKRVESELAKARKKSDAAKESADKRWNGNAKAMRTHMPTQSEGICERDAITITEINNIHSGDTARAFKPFPATGSIAYTSPYVETIRKYANGADPDMFAQAFRKFCESSDIDLGDRLIGKKLETFCKKHRINGARAA